MDDRDDTIKDDEVEEIDEEVQQAKAEKPEKDTEETFADAKAMADKQETEETEEKTEPETEIWQESFDKAQDESREWESKYKRALADYQNLEKRVAEQRREWMIASSRELLNRLLPVLDTLVLASQHVEDQGLKISIQQFEDVLKAEGVVRIETKGKKFDPIQMEAVGTRAGDEGKVLEETRAGYMLHEKLLRPAQVIVGSGKGAKE
jgi:molecular chaperone GrpE